MPRGAPIPEAAEAAQRKRSAQVQSVIEDMTECVMLQQAEQRGSSFRYSSCSAFEFRTSEGIEGVVVEFRP